MIARLTRAPRRAAYLGACVIVAALAGASLRPADVDSWPSRACAGEAEAMTASEPHVPQGDPPLLATVYDAAIYAWSGVGAREARIASFARGVAVAVEIDPPLVTGTDAKLRTALWLVALAQSETDFAEWALDGSCNAFAWRQRNGVAQCDHGVAYGPWQMHVDEQRSVRGGPSGVELIGDPTLAAREAIRWLRDTPTAWGSWSAQRARAARWYAARYVVH